MGSKFLTSSRLKDARACPRLHHYRYELGYRPAVEAEALRFGTLVHKGLEAWWRATTSSRLTAALEALRAASGESDAFEVAKAEAMLIGYDARWGDQPYEVLGVELPFETELRNPATGQASRTWRLAGKIDAIVRDQRDNRVLLVEHKTASGDVSPGSEYWRRLRMDGQVSIYFEGAFSLGHEVSGCLYDVLSKPGQRPSKATAMEDRKYKKDGTLYANLRLTDESPLEYQKRVMEAIGEDPMGFFQRGEVVRLEEEMKDALFDVWQTGQNIREGELTGRAPRNPDACARYGRTCEFFSVCTGEASLDDPLHFKRSDEVHPELSP